MREMLAMCEARVITYFRPFSPLTRTSSMCVKNLDFLQLTAELFIGAEGRAIIVHLGPNHSLLSELAANLLVSSTHSSAV